MVPGIDVAGTVAAIGESVVGFEVGDRVHGTGIGKNHYSGYAEYAAVPDDRLVTLPSDVDTVASGGTGVVSVTAWRALIDHTNLRTADICLIHGDSGGVGHAATQIATASGARVITTADPVYHDDLYALGADVVLDTRATISPRQSGKQGTASSTSSSTTGSTSTSSSTPMSRT